MSNVRKKLVIVLNKISGLNDLQEHKKLFPVRLEIP
jgi:hypothetical protein